MGFFSSLMEAAEAAVPWSTVEAEAPAEVETEGVKVGCFFCLSGGAMEG